MMRCMQSPYRSSTDEKFALRRPLRFGDRRQGTKSLEIIRGPSIRGRGARKEARKQADRLTWKDLHQTDRERQAQVRSKHDLQRFKQCEWPAIFSWVATGSAFQMARRSTGRSGPRTFFRS